MPMTNHTAPNSRTISKASLNRSIFPPSSAFAADRRRRSRAPPASALELGVPIEIIAPGIVQIVGREGAAVFLQHEARRLHRAVARVHAALLGQAVALQQVAVGAGGDDVGPNRAPAARARH